MPKMPSFYITRADRTTTSIRWEGESTVKDAVQRVIDLAAQETINVGFSLITRLPIAGGKFGPQLGTWTMLKGRLVALDAKTARLMKQVGL